MKYKYIDQTPEIIWDEKGQPLSKAFDDIYYSPIDGLSESRHIFIDGNHLSERWQGLKDGELFTIFESGFGSGLNFLATMHLWQELSPVAHLQYISLEGFPLSQSQLERALQPWQSQLEAESVSLINNYDALLNQTGPVDFPGNISLRLIKRKANELSKQDVETDIIDAIFMDGFSPVKNPDMWSTLLCDYLFDIAKPGASLATFSVAGLVKRNLKQAGFELCKQPGFGKKREMLTATKPVEGKEPGHHNL